MKRIFAGVLMLVFGLAMPLLWPVGFILLIWGLISVGMAGGKADSPGEFDRLRDGFNPTYEAANIAIDVPAGKVWLRDASGHEAIFNKGDLLRWQTGETSGRDGFFIVKFPFPSLAIHVSDLSRPRYDVVFHKYSTGNIKNVYARNQAERDEWYSRLTTWVNDTVI